MKVDINKRIKKELTKNHACYILITCDSPTDSGEMKVEMSYSGDTTLAAYLLEGAQSYINEQDSQFDYTPHNNSKVLPLRRTAL